MGYLDGTTRYSGKICVSIPVITCSGRKGSITTSAAGSYLTMSGSRYWDINDGYLHIDEKTLAEKKFYPGLATKADIIAAICELNKLYFAGTLIIDSEMFRLDNRRILTDKGEILDLDVAVRLSPPPLGGTWQKYYSDSNWLKEAQKLKGAPIYLA